MAEFSPSNSVAQSEVPPADSPPTPMDTEPTGSNASPPAPMVTSVVLRNKFHRCPIHRDERMCKGARVEPEDEEISSTLTDPTITFDKSQEQLRKKTRGGSKLLPPTLYRVFYEGSATLSSRVSKDTHVRHRENKQLKLRNGNAFQTIGEVVFNKSVTKEGIERHLVWNKKKDPSTWISMFHGFGHATKRARFHYTESKRIGQRVTIAEISTSDLVAATLHANCKTVWEIMKTTAHWTKRLHYSVTTRQVEIPVWVNRSVRPADGSSIKAEELMASNDDLFVSIKELNNSNLVAGPDSHSRRRTIRANGHAYEWLALGRIREERIMKVIPFDGTAFHMVKPSYTVRSEDATEDWIFDFELETWRLESEMKRANARKRRITEVDDDDDDVFEVASKEVCKCKRSNTQALSLSTVEIIYHI